MDILGVGPLEVIFVILIALILFGPNDMVKAGRTLGRFLRRLVTSEEWRAMQKASKELSQLPTRLMREAGMEEAQILLAEVKRTSEETVLDSLKDVQRWKEDIGEDAAPPVILPTPAEAVNSPAVKPHEEEPPQK